MPEFKTIHTNYGLGRIAAAEATGSAINLVVMAVGDGNGNPTTPDPAQTVLVRERYRAPINRVYQEPDDARVFTAELVVPYNIGGFVMREIALYDSNGSLFAVGNLPDTYKPVEGEGAFSDTVIRMQFVLSSSSIVNLVVDPNTASASHTWVINTFASMVVIPGGTTNQVLAKTSNADGDYDWKDPTEANVIVRSIEENQTLAANQTLVTLSKTTNVGLSVYVAGVRLRNDQWTPTPGTSLSLSLATSYAAGTKITLAQNDPNGTFFDPLFVSRNLSDVPDKALGRANLGVYSKEEVVALLPTETPGQICYFGGLTAPVGWLKANGAAISRTAYADLFAYMGTIHGQGDGFTTFNLPDLRGEFIRCLDDGRGVDLGRASGSFQAGQNELHTHAGTAATNGTHSHTYYDTDTYLTNTSGLSGGNNFTDRTSAASTSSGGAHTHTLTIEKSGGTEARPRNIALLACVKY